MQWFIIALKLKIISFKLSYYVHNYLQKWPTYPNLCFRFELFVNNVWTYYKSIVVRLRYIIMYYLSNWKMFVLRVLCIFFIGTSRKYRNCILRSNDIGVVNNIIRSYTITGLKNHATAQRPPRSQASIHFIWI